MTQRMVAKKTKVYSVLNKESRTKAMFSLQYLKDKITRPLGLVWHTEDKIPKSYKYGSFS